MTKYFLRLFLVLLTLSFVSCNRGKSLVAKHESDGKEHQEEFLIAVDATVYRGLMQMLGIGDRCVDFSNEMKPDPEKVLTSGAKMLMLSVYDGIDTTKYQRMGINVVACTDFMETTPLARAAWMKRFGRLWGVAERADSLYRVVEGNYKSLQTSLPLTPPKEGSSERTKLKKYSKNKAELSESPSLGGVRGGFIFDLPYGSLWYQPSEYSTLGQIVIDAGGTLPFGIKQEGGSVGLSREQMLAKGADADLWIIRYQGEKDMTLADLKALDPVYKEFRAFKDGNVWGCNISIVPYFDETAFRPDWLLAEMKYILGGGKDEAYKPRYFKKIR